MTSVLKNAVIALQNVGVSDIAYRKLGTGPPLLFVHGFPLNGMTWRGVVPQFTTRFTCYVLDLPGVGQSKWTAASRDFDFRGSAESIKLFAERQGLHRYTLFAHDTGATIAREVAIIDKDRVEKLVAVNTEIPNHRPPTIQLLQWMSYLPLSDWATRTMFGSTAFLKSTRGFGLTFQNLSLLEPGTEFHEYFIQPGTESARFRLGQRSRLRGIDWGLVDSMATRHSEIQCPVLFIWGDACATFPVDLARAMVPQFTNTTVTFKTIRGAKTFCQDEFPDEVAKLGLEFLAV